MIQTRLGVVESQFADIVWSNAPLSTKELVELCEKELNWKRTTTYTVLKKFCNRQIFSMNKQTVTVLITKEEFQAMQSEQFVQDTFQGSLPAFIAAFTTRKTLSQKELEEIKRMVESFE
ncbi:MAG: BlaI/MecI/CopY family transcriptional regulator [Oscillospiraceae bacterium]|nr:BlaI/MecI/CopY family transcriptional regulator [Oscillospiraceae bacterium]